VMIANPASPSSLCEFPLGAEWTGVSASIAPGAIPNPLPLGPLGANVLTTFSVDLPVLSNSDQISIGFDSLTP